MAYGNAKGALGAVWQDGKIISLPMEDNTTVYEGSAVLIKAGKAGFDGGTVGNVCAVLLLSRIT